MGFGILFLGYLLSVLGIFVPFGFVLRLIGYIFMSISLLKLIEFGREFMPTLIISFFMTIYGIYDAVYQGAEKLSITLPDFFNSVAGVMAYVNIMGVVVLNLSLMYSIHIIASRLDLSKQRNASIRNAIVVFVYFVLSILGMGPLSGNNTYIKYFGLPTILLQLAWIVLNLILIFSCYMYICPEGDEDMPRHESKFEFVNKFRNESDRRAEQAVRDTEEYVRKKQKDRMERLEQKNNKKRKK